MTRHVALLVVCQLALACDGEQDDASAGTSGGEAGTSAASSSGAPPGEAATSDEQDDESGSTGDPSSGESSSSGRDCTPLPWYPDNDGDGFGPDDGVIMTCDPPPNHVPTGGDCDDDEPDVAFAGDEVCDAIDNDCDGLVDEPAATNAECGGCSLFESGSSGYAICADAASWTEAQTQCEETFGGTLVVIDSPAENTAVLALVAEDVPSLWIGFSDLETEGTFAWADGTPVDHTNWNAGEPNDAAGNEDCAQLAQATGYWNDFDCAMALPFICEVAL